MQAKKKNIYKPTDISIFDEMKKDVEENKKLFLDTSVVKIEDDLLFIFSKKLKKGLYVRKSKNL